MPRLELSLPVPPPPPLLPLPLSVPPDVSPPVLLCFEPAPERAMALNSFISPAVVPASTTTEPATVVPSPRVALAPSSATLNATAALTLSDSWSLCVNARLTACVCASMSLIALTDRSPLESIVRPLTISAVTSDTITAPAIEAAMRSTPPEVSVVDWLAFVLFCAPGLLV